MNKKLVATLCASLMAFSLVSCGGEDKKADGGAAAPELKAGTYEVEQKEADDKGNSAKISITVDAAGKITEVKYNEFNTKDNVNKRDNEEYNKMMKDKAGTNPAEFEPVLENAIKDKQSAEIDTVTGATNSTETAKQLAKAAIENAKAGKTEKTSVEISKAK